MCRSWQLLLCAIAVAVDVRWSAGAAAAASPAGDDPLPRGRCAEVPGWLPAEGRDVAPGLQLLTPLPAPGALRVHLAGLVAPLDVLVPAEHTEPVPRHGRQSPPAAAAAEDP